MDVTVVIEGNECPRSEETAATSTILDGLFAEK